MCLSIRYNHAKELQEFKNKHHKKEITLYKVLRVVNDNKYYSPYIEDTKWYLGRYKGSTRRSTKITKCEEHYREIYEGLHLFINKEDAIKDRNSWNITWNITPDCYREYVLCKVKVLKKDLVAIGTFEKNPSIVATRVFFDSVIE